MKKSLDLAGNVPVYVHGLWRKIFSLLLTFGILLLLALLTVSCAPDSDLEELQPAEELSPESGIAVLKGPVFSLPITLHKVDLYTHTATGLTGSVTVQIQSADGSVVYGTRTLSSGSIVKGDALNTFTFSPALTLSSGQKYRISVIRTNPHNYSGGDYFFWRSSSIGNDAYPKGVMNFFPGSVNDYAFRTYSDGYLDQQQTSHVYGYAVGDIYFHWQEFVPEKIWIIHP